MATRQEKKRKWYRSAPNATRKSHGRETKRHNRELHWKGERIGGETAFSRVLPYEMHERLSQGYTWRGLANKLAAKLASTIDEVEVERDVKAAEQAKPKRQYWKAAGE